MYHAYKTLVTVLFLQIPCILCTMHTKHWLQCHFYKDTMYTMYHAYKTLVTVLFLQRYYVYYVPCIQNIGYSVILTKKPCILCTMHTKHWIQCHFYKDTMYTMYHVYKTLVTVLFLQRYYVYYVPCTQNIGYSVILTKKPCILCTIHAKHWLQCHCTKQTHSPFYYV